jgi:hypothetical protein
MKGSNKRSFCRISTLSIQAMLMPSYCIGANRITGLIWLAQRVLITNSRLSKRPDLRQVNFRLIGKPNKPLAQKGARVAVGHLPSTIARTRSSRSNSRARTANAVRAVHCVRIRLVSVAPSPCVLNSTIKHYNRHGSVLRRKTSKLYMRAARG